MTNRDSPRIDHRSAAAVFGEAARRLGLTPGRTGPFAEALLRVFARYCEIVIERLNRVPEKNRLAFLSRLAISPTPPSPAKVPITFEPVKQLPGVAAPPRAGEGPPSSRQTADLGGVHRVPRHTRVAAKLGPGESEPVVFETERDVVLTAARLKRIIAHDPASDRYADRSAWASKEGGMAGEAFAGDMPVEHALYLGDSTVFGAAGTSELRLRFELLNRPSPLPRDALEWSIRTPEGPPIALQPAEDGTAQLSRSGEVVFRDLPDWPRTKVRGLEHRWLICRLRRGSGSALRVASLPVVRGIRLQASGTLEETPIAQAFCNTIPLDVSKPFFPFGERPRFGDVFYLGSEAFSRPGACITLKVGLLNPVSSAEPSPVRPVHGEGNPRLVWEIWDGERWAGLSGQDQSRALTRAGVIRFASPVPAVKGVVNGQEGFWMRARLASGHYGEEERIEPAAADNPAGFRRIPATLSPPVIEHLSVEGTLRVHAAGPERIMTCNALVMESVDPARQGAFPPFAVAAERALPSLYLGLEASAEGTLSAPILDIYFHTDDPAARRYSRHTRERARAPVIWQAWGGKFWEDVRAEDGTAGLTASGTVRLYLDRAVKAREDFCAEAGLCWLRVTSQPGGPPLRRIALNTVPAIHALTVRDELLGTSTGSPRQVFRSVRVPIVGDLRLHVREPEQPAAAEFPQSAPGDDAVTIERDEQGRVQAIWVRWREVEDFLSSTPDDRHFLVDRLTGEIAFGDGVRGRIPPAGANNIRLSRYRSGGGALGNKPVGSVSQLRTTVPFVAAATNPEPALGGQDAESPDAMRERGARCLRHQGRAVTVEDYEDLAVAASPAVARAGCFPLRNLLDDGSALLPGTVSVVVVPRDDSPEPRPTIQLLEEVRLFLSRRSMPDVDIIALAPEYLRISVDLEIRPVAPAALTDCMDECRRRLQAFLHPVTGGPRQRGWAFGRTPREADFHRLFDGIEGLASAHVAHVRQEEERPGLAESAAFLICSGGHRVYPVSRQGLTPP